MNLWWENRHIESARNQNWNVVLHFVFIDSIQYPPVSMGSDMSLKWYCRSMEARIDIEEWKKGALIPSNSFLLFIYSCKARYTFALVSQTNSNTHSQMTYSLAPINRNISQRSTLEKRKRNQEREIVSANRIRIKQRETEREEKEIWQIYFGSRATRAERNVP